MANISSYNFLDRCKLNRDNGQWMNKMHSKFNILKNKDGQSLIEFVMLLVVLLSSSLIMFNVIRGRIKTRWVSIIKLIAAPVSEEIKFR